MEAKKNVDKLIIENNLEETVFTFGRFHLKQCQLL